MKIDDLAAYITAHVGAVDAMKLQKLLYYTQAWSLAVTNRKLFDEPLEAWRDGPVVDYVYQQHKFGTVRTWDGDATQVTGDEKTLVDAVLAQYSGMTANELSDLTHAEQPWKSARAGLAPTARSRKHLDADEIGRFYRGARTLVGRKAPDLAAGGIVYIPGVTVPALSDVSAELAEVAESIRTSSTSTPDSTVIVGRASQPSRRLRTTRASRTVDMRG